MQDVFASTSQGSWAARQPLPSPRRQRWTKILCSFLTLILLIAVAAQTQGANAEAFPTDAIGRLITDEERQCTAFIMRSEERRVTGRFSGSILVFENWLASAGHCLGRRHVFVQGTRTYETRVVGFSSEGVRGFDVMVLSFVTERRLPALELAFGEYPQVGDPLMLIGYGAKALMMRVGPLLRYDERGRMEIHSYASRGNSGGPVLLPGTRRVVGIGIETTLDQPVGASSLFCIMAGCPVKPPYVAAHIDRLRGIANFR